MSFTSKDIVFVTTSLFSKYLDYQQKIIKTLFPESEILVVDGRGNWPNVWFSWIDLVKDRKEKFFIHIDEDCFLLESQQIYQILDSMESENKSLAGMSDGYNKYRSHNPITINPFFMIGKIADLKECWDGNKFRLFKPKYKVNFTYPHNQYGEHQYDDFEPFYCFFWAFKDKGKEFLYLFPHFDETYKSSNLAITEANTPFLIHMWYSRTHNHNHDVFGTPNCERYEAIERDLLSKL